MIKIETSQVGDQVTLKIEGRLAGAWVSELEDSWRAAAKHSSGKLALDLTGVTFIDQTGCYLLRLMRHDGVSFITAGLMTEELADLLAHERKHES
jgi:anti-anti-sigma regulatory factor